MASIGPYTVFSISGLPEPPQHKNVLLERPGVDGAAARTEGLRAEVTTIQTTTFLADAAAILTTPQTYASLVGALVAVQDDFGNIVYNVFVQNVRVLRIHRIGVGNPTAYARLECQWELMRWL